MPALELERFADVLERVADQMPDLRRELNAQLADMAKRVLDEHILSTGVRDAHGHVRSWQVTQVGSGGGYGAVHPVTVRGAGDDSPAAITYYLDQGRIRSYPHTSTIRGRVHRRRSDEEIWERGYVHGKFFYQRATLVAKAKAVELAEQAMRDIAKQIGG